MHYTMSMQFLNLPLICLICLTLPACSSDTVKRTTYGTLQNIEKQQCQKELREDCPEQDSYDAYQKQRQQQ